MTKEDKERERRERENRKRRSELKGGKLSDTVRRRMLAEDPDAHERDFPRKYREHKEKISNQKGSGPKGSGPKGSGPKGGGGLGGAGAGGIGPLKLIKPPYKKMKNGGEVKKKKGRRGMGAATRGGGSVA